MKCSDEKKKCPIILLSFLKQELHEAYDILIDDTQRKLYDERLRVQSSGREGRKGVGGINANIYNYDSSDNELKCDSDETVDLRESASSDEDGDDFYGSDDVEIDKHEFLLLMIIRLGVVDVSLVRNIYRRFDKRSGRVPDLSSKKGPGRPGQSAMRAGTPRGTTPRGGTRSRRLSLEEIMAPPEMAL